MHIYLPNLLFTVYSFRLLNPQPKDHCFVSNLFINKQVSYEYLNAQFNIVIIPCCTDHLGIFIVYFELLLSQTVLKVWTSCLIKTTVFFVCLFVCCFFFCFVLFYFVLLFLFCFLFCLFVLLLLFLVFFYFICFFFFNLYPYLNTTYLKYDFFVFLYLYILKAKMFKLCKILKIKCFTA